MTSKERMCIALLNGQPDMVPVAPDISNMIPCRLTGKPFWDIYLYQDPPLWQAYIEAAKFFNFDGWLPHVPVEFPFEEEARKQGPPWREAIVTRTPDRIYTRQHYRDNGKEIWTDWCTAYYIDNPPTYCVALSDAGLPKDDPKDWEDVTPRNDYPGLDAYYKACEMMGDDGIVGLMVALPGLYAHQDSIYEYYDNQSAVIERCEREHKAIIKRTKAILALNPDEILIGSSGHMLFNPEPIFRQLSLPTMQEVTALAKAASVPCQVHCCGPEYTLVKIAAEETDISNVNPLEIPPMGDCNLAQIKKEFGHKVSLMGNLHTTEVMLKGSVEDVQRASKAAIDDAAEGGGFLLSTGDQCGRDTPDENIRAMVEVARTYGRY
ncbi:MAG: uroporphyrinogen decarboxylase family protein [Armatimonadota bacterium]